MKRHGFGGLRASHGVSISHRAIGSTGQCQDPGKVFKGKKMAGQMGDVQVTSQNLQVVSTDTDRGLILVKGAVPGSKGGFILVSDAVKKPLPDGVPMPGAVRGGAAAAKDAPAEDESPAEEVQEEAVEAAAEEAPAEEAAPEAEAQDAGDADGEENKE